MKNENGNEIDENKDLNDPKKTGYEGTGETDTFGQIEVEDNVETPGEKKPAIDEEKAKAKDLEKDDKDGEQKAKDQAAEFEAEQEKTGKELEEEIDKDLPDAEKDKDKEKDKETVDDKDKEKEPELFDTDKLEEDLETETNVKKTAETVNWEDVSKTIKLPDDLKIVPKENTLEGFKEAVKVSIEAATKKTEFNLDGFEDDTKEVINYFVNKGSKEDLLRPLKEIDDYIIMKPEEKVKEFLMESEKLSEEDADAKINDMIEAETFDAKVKDIDSKLLNLRETTFKSIISKRQDDTTVLAEAKKEENKEMTDYVDEMKSFMGVKLPDKVKSYIKKEIDAGKLAKMNNNAEAQVLARLFMLYGTDILKKIN